MCLCNFWQPKSPSTLEKPVLFFKKHPILWTFQISPCSSLTKTPSCALPHIKMINDHGAVSWWTPWLTFPCHPCLSSLIIFSEKLPLATKSNEVISSSRHTTCSPSFRTRWSGLIFLFTYYSLLTFSTSSMWAELRSCYSNLTVVTYH